MTTEFNLSKKFSEDKFGFCIADIQEFIRLLKEEIEEPSSIYNDEFSNGLRQMCFRINEILDKLAGEKLK